MDNGVVGWQPDSGVRVQPATEPIYVSGSMGIAELKTINYHGGVVRFRVPVGWQEEYEQDGSGTFYAPGEDTGTLRLDVLTMEAPPGMLVGASTPAEVLEDDSRKHSTPVMPLRENMAMIRYDLPAEEQGRRLLIRYWHVAQAIPPRNARLALFSYTLLAEQLDDPGTHAELELIDREIRSAELAPVLGQVATAKKPWWRLW